MTPKRAHPEWDFQRVCFAFLTKALPEGSYVVSLDSAQKGSATQRVLDARRGIRPGQLDMLVLTSNFPPGKIELKVPGGAVSEHQKTDMLVWQRNGGWAFVAYSLDEIEAGLRAQGIPLRASAGGRWEKHLAEMEARAAKKPRARKAWPKRVTARGLAANAFRQRP